MTPEELNELFDMLHKYESRATLMSASIRVCSAKTTYLRKSVHSSICFYVIRVLVLPVILERNKLHIQGNGSGETELTNGLYTGHAYSLTGVRKVRSE